MKAYGSLELTQSSPPQSFTEPISLEDVRVFIVDSASTGIEPAQDLMLNSFITAARETAEILQGYDLIQKQYDLHLDLLLGHDAIAGAAYPLRNNSLYNFGIGYEVELRHPLQSVDLFQVTDRAGAVTTLVEDTDYVVDTHRSIVTPPWGKVWPFFTPAVTSSVLIRFTSGYAPNHPFWSNAGQRILQGMRLMISEWYNCRVPFEPGRISQEYPYAITALLGFGARPRVH